MGRQALDDIQAFAERHRRGIGSTDAAAILGLSPWSSPFDVWAEKVGESEPREPSFRMSLGLALQDTVGTLFADRNGVRLRADNRQHAHRQRDWQVAHLDFRVWGDPRTIVEAKTATGTDGWGEDGSADVPTHYWCQVQHQMAVTGATQVWIATLFGHRDFRAYPIARDDDFIAALNDAEDEFWRLHVLTRTPPPMDGSDGARRFLARRYPADDGLMLPATPEQAELVDQFRAADAVADAADKARDTIRNRLIEIIGPNAGLRGGDFQITYRQVAEGAPVVDWQAVATALAGPDTDVAALAAAHSGPGRKAYRRWDFTDRKGHVE